MQSDDLAGSFARVMFRAVFVGGADLSDLATTLGAAERIGADSEAVAAATTDPEIKAALMDNVTDASRRGVCGVPFMFLEGEPFFGADRLDQVERFVDGLDRLVQ